MQFSQFNQEEQHSVQGEFILELLLDILNICNHAQELRINAQWLITHWLLLSKSVLKLKVLKVKNNQTNSHLLKIIHSQMDKWLFSNKFIKMRIILMMTDKISFKLIKYGKEKTLFKLRMLNILQQHNQLNQHNKHNQYNQQLQLQEEE